MSKINIGDSWKDIEKIKINVGWVWKDASSASINIGDVWKNFYSTSTGNWLLNWLQNYWKFDEWTWSTSADSIGTDTATLINNPTWVTWKMWMALDYNGTNNYSKTNATITDWETVSNWSNVTNLSADQILLADMDSWTTNNWMGIRYNDSTQSIQQWMYSPASWFNVVNEISIPSTWWYWIIAHFENWDWELTINNVTTTNSTVYTMPTWLSGINWGRFWDITPTYKSWTIDETWKWSRKLTTDEKTTWWNNWDWLPLNDYEN